MITRVIEYGYFQRLSNSRVQFSGKQHKGKQIAGDKVVHDIASNRAERKHQKILFRDSVIVMHKTAPLSLLPLSLKKNESVT
jgi:hypothetical protein